MEPELNQDMSVNNEEITPEEAKASLGLATRLSEGFLMAQVPPEMQHDAPEQTQPQESEESAPAEKEPATEENKEDDIEKLIDESVKEAVKEELATFKKELQDALEEDED